MSTTPGQEYQRRWHESHPGYHNRHRITAVEKLGGRCVGCGGTESEFLSIDHILDDGHVQRRALKWTGSIYRNIANTVDSGAYQVLCLNCNIEKSLVCVRRHEAVVDGKACKSCDRLLGPSAYRKRGDGWTRTTCKDCESDLRRDVKVKVFTAFGNVCTCCSEPRLACLALDHVNGDGSQLRRDRVHLNGYNLYRRILNGSVLTVGLQLMCFNCNFSKHIGGVCVHRRP